MTAILLKTETLPFGTRFDYSITHPDGTVGYTHVIVGPDDVIRRDTVPAPAAKPARNAKYEQRPATAEAPGPNAKYETLLEPVEIDGKTLMREVRGKLLDPGTVRTLVDPGTNEVELRARDATPEEVQTHVTAQMVAKEAAWIVNKPAKAA